MIVEESKLGDDSRFVMAAMIMLDDVAGFAADLWEEHGLFRREDIISNAIGKIIVDYRTNHGKAPAGNMMLATKRWASTCRDKALVQGVYDMLAHVNRECQRLPEDINPQHAKNVAGDVFNIIRIQEFADRIHQFAEEKKVDRAQKEFNDYQPLDAGADTKISLFTDMKALGTVFAQERSEPLFKYPGALGEFFADQLSRGKFISFMGGEGSGKSWWLADVSIRALTKHRRVAYFDMGDQDAPDVMERFAVRVAGEPFRSDSGKWPFVVQKPNVFDVFWNVADSCQDYHIEYEETSFPKRLSQPEAEAAVKTFQRRVIKSKTPYFHQWHFPTGTGTVGMIRDKLIREAKQGWAADVVVIDYADIIKPSTSKKESRDEINDIWQKLRALSLELNVLVVTATQINREGIKSKGSPRMEHVGEEKRKMAHVSAMFGIKADDEDTESQVLRLNQVKRRSGKKTIRPVWVAQCLGIGMPAVMSAFMKPKKEAE